jgi:hypothetical protein
MSIHFLKLSGQVIFFRAFFEISWICNWYGTLTRSICSSIILSICLIVAATRTVQPKHNRRRMAGLECLILATVDERLVCLLANMEHPTPQNCFTKYESLSVINLLNVICRDIIVYYSYNQHPISMVANVPSDDCKKDQLKLFGIKLCDAQFQIYSYLPNTILFTDSTSKPLRVFHQFIDMAKRSCTCFFYIDRAICHHLIFSSKLFKFTIGKQSITAKTFVKMKSSSRKKKNSKALQK